VKPKVFLVLMTAIAVISDSMLHPFYPQYFAQVFGVVDPRHVGLYIAACSFTVLTTFPGWALLARKVGTLQLLIATQLVAGVLSMVCWGLGSLAWFWGVSLAMMVCKASYLLIYPYVMTLESKEHHVETIGLLAFVVYFGNILAALLAGMVFEWMDHRSLFAVMAIGDVLQILLCAYLLRRPAPVPAAASEDAAAAPPPRAPAGFTAKLGSVMLLLYFSAYLTEPFFSAYWERVAAIDHKVVTGLVFALPGMAALLGLYVNARTRESPNPFGRIAPAILLATASLWLQASGAAPAVLVGRFVYGWALFQAMVRLDSLLFRLSTPDEYAVTFSKFNLFQGLGVLVASLVAGTLASSLGLGATFLLSAGGFAIGAALYGWLFRAELRPATTAAAAAAAPAPAAPVVTAQAEGVPT